MKKGDRVKMSPMWKYSEAYGVVLKISREGLVSVHWDNINGEWIYTKDQAKNIEVVIEKTGEVSEPR